MWTDDRVRFTLADPDGSSLTGYLDLTGSVAIEPQFSLAMPFSEGRARFEGDEGAWGYIDTAGTPVIPPQWDVAYCFANGFASAGPGEGLLPVAIEEAWGYIDRTGAFVIPQHFESASLFSDGRARVRLTGRKSDCYIDVAGHMLESVTDSP